MTDNLTPEQRARLSEDELVESDLRRAKYDPAQEAAVRSLIRERVRREREDAEDARLAAEAGVTVHAIRQARAEGAARERSERDRADLETARQTVRTGSGHGLRSIPEATPENVRAERERLEAAGEPHGYKTLAKHFVTSVGTIRRRLDMMK